MHPARPHDRTAGMDTSSERTIDPAALELPLRGARLGGIETLGALLREPTLLAFLRHGG